MMGGWRRQHCPNSKCDKRFHAVQDALDPSRASAEEFFKFINHTETGRITQDELAAWYSTNFTMTSADAMKAIQTNWKLWDVPKNHSFLKLGWLRSKDQGDLDMDEFRQVHEFMKESLAISLTSTAVPPVAELKSESISPELRGEKRPRSEADSLTDGVLRKVAQRKQVQSEDLQCKLRSNTDKGREWFDHFDFDKSGELSKPELITALLQTFMGSHQMTREKITDIVNGVWDAIDTDGDGSVRFDEFQVLREALIAQLNHERVARAVAQID